MNSDGNPKSPINQDGLNIFYPLRVSSVRSHSQIFGRGSRALNSLVTFNLNCGHKNTF